ncbi:DUF2339 domain-containing protein [Acinetobacter johnsonii]|uniref:DUF2339 domain-containing protein n=1 Tax=Acinetobacter johnsonii TaxID=40214 RepID=A0A1R7QAP2_ACIJO|nr:DUF2339 domain-containing protein [Acinetobacter johnsonii]SJX21332.1 hypothetical protein ACNJC6_00942 [Acinetobacter johnsonii]
MQTGQREIRMMWLMGLTIVAIAAWFLAVPLLSALCGIALIMSVMHYVDSIENPSMTLAEQRGIAFQPTSKVPLYLAAFVILIGMVGQWGGLIGLGISGWLFFFFRWLRRLEYLLLSVQAQPHQVIFDRFPESENAPSLPTTLNNTDDLSLSEQVKRWLWQGNPVLKVAIVILLIGLILLLRFATEHWQLSLAVKLSLVAAVSVGVVIFGYVLQHKNRSFALALEALGLSSLFLTLFFTYYNGVIASLAIASLCFVVVMAVTLWLSLKQQSIELALMALIIAYLAPFTLPVRNATAIEMVAYYLIINIAVAVLSTFRPWKVLNQIAFLMTVVVGGAYVFYQGKALERDMLAVLILAHSTVFIWLSFRYSQLLAREDLTQFKLKPILDVALIFAAPIVAFAFLYVMYFEETIWQAGFSLGFAALYAMLYQLLKRAHSVELIAQSYLSLTLVFLALIPPILLPDQWGVVGWSIEGALIFMYALYRNSALSRYLAMGLLAVAGLSSLYYVVELNRFPTEVYWALCLSYFVVVAVANSVERFRQQLSFATIAFFCLQLLSATSMLFILLLDEIDSKSQVTMALLIIVLLYTVLNEWLLYRKVSWSWLLPKWIGLIPLYAVAFIFLVGLSHDGIIMWQSGLDRLLFALTSGLLTLLWLRPLQGVEDEQEWVSLGALLSLALTSLTLIPSMPYLSMVILPLAFAAWCYVKPIQTRWRTFWQARNTLVLMLLWIVCSQIFSQQAFVGYWLPIFNPFDLVSIAMLIGFIWMLNLQMKAGLEKSLGAILMMSSLLWLSSYVVLRALHVYFLTPYNDWEMWENALVQLSFTLLWVSLAFICMLTATKRNLRSLWIFGGCILVLVTLKLVLFDLSHIGTLTRVISFLGAGLVMLVIAYIAPMPELEEKTN